MLAAGAAWARPGLPDFADLVEKHSAAVVNISTTQSVESPLSGLQIPNLPPDHPLRDFIDRFLGERELPPESRDAQSLGSGFIIDAGGYILTNYHVVRNASEVIVRLSDRREFVAELLGSDERTDLALLKIEANDLPVVTIGSASRLRVGEWVLAIGSPFGFDHSVTAGIVSAKGRNLPTENYVPFIQTDVAINPGNSGGPLFNLDGEVVGINSQIYSRTGGFMGLSFAIPVELAMDVAEQLKESGKVSRGWLGVMIQDVTRELAQSFGMSKPYGALVSQVMEGSPAARAGLQVGDVIVEYDGREISTSAALPPMVGRSAIGESVPVKVIREGKPRSLKVRIGELPENIGGSTSGMRGPVRGSEEARELGLTLESLDQEQRETLALDGPGLLVVEVTSGPAQRAGILPGDVLLRINQRSVDSLEGFRELVRELPRGRPVPVLIQRDGAPRFLALSLPGEE
ncbi:DegQ family serine endoprotease [Alkalilimnicola sp. S0819]|nr:DegQ family serine endoprotease [Alkalilimnicola sp. S0819]MPQ15712.1 Do family serine endopeptidase [Alkalilimnicola sp. S0819]